MKLTNLIFGLVYLIILHESIAQELTPIVKVADGEIQGTVEGTIHFYQGIKYGQASRFRRPEKASPWNGIYNATLMRYACPQPEVALSNHSFIDQSHTLRRTRVSNEDCLYLNVFRPATEQHQGKKRAVMVWIHGGTFVGGTIFDRGFDAHYIASIGDVIVVTINYRLGAFGFLLGDGQEHPGNLGLYDQILGLEWVKENIAAFGGDPSQVTLFGESAGAMSVGALILSPLADGLFHRAIMQSGAPNSFIGSENKTAAEGKVKFLASFLSCDRATLAEIVQCIESKSIEQIQTITNTMAQLGQYFEPTYGTELLPLNPVEALKSGKFNSKKLDILFGVNRDEGASGVYSLFSDIKPNSGKPITIETVRDSVNMMTEVFRVQNHSEVSDWYTRNLNASDQVAMRNAIANTYGDINLVCPTMFFGQQFANLAPTNRYYTYRLVQTLANGQVGCPEWMGVCHAYDLNFVFGHTLDVHKQQTTHRDYRLSFDIIQAWTSFAKNGYPGKMGSIEWSEAFDPSHVHGGLESMRTMWLDADDYKMVTGFFSLICDAFWRQRIF